MKPILVAALAILSLGTTQAVEYVTLTHSNSSKAVSPTDLVEVVGCSSIRSRFATNLRLSFPDGLQITSDIGGVRESNSNVASVNTTLGHKYTGLIEVRNLSPDIGVVTLKITSASEINAVTPSSVLVLPENSTGDFDVIIESSSDLVSWLPFFSQTVNSQTARRFFRTRVVRASVQPPLRPVEPNGGDSDR